MVFQRLLAAILHQVGVGWELHAALLKTDEFLHSWERKKKKSICTLATDGFPDTSCVFFVVRFCAI